MYKVKLCSVCKIQNVLSNTCIIRKLSSIGGGRVMRTIKKYLLPSDVKPPYHHICQVGDPVLRLQAKPVDLEVIPTAKFKQFIDQMIDIMRKYKCFGLAASQIGSPLQVIVMETTVKNLIEARQSQSSGQPMEVMPLRVFINPKMTILDYKTLIYPEGCASICGFTAHVPRAKTVKIEALDLSGNSFVWEADGWPARVAQHEMDHLQGKVFTDRMDPKTFSCSIWNMINLRGGDVIFHYNPARRSKLRKLFGL